MNVKKREPYSVLDISKKLDYEDEDLLYGQFLDDFFYIDKKELKENLIKEEPIFNDKNKIFLCILAGTVQKLANDYGLYVPKWVYDKKYVLDDIYYAFDTKIPEYREYLRDHTPDEYKNRNLYVGETLLERR